MTGIIKKISTVGTDAWDRIIWFKKRFFRSNAYKAPKWHGAVSSVQLTEEQKKEIDAFFLKNYGHKVPYIYHQYATAFNGKFDPQYFPACCYGGELNHYLHYDTAYNKVLADKNLLACFAGAAGVKTPQTLLSRAAGAFRDENNRLVSREQFEEKLANLGEAFAKPAIESAGGAGCFLIRMQGGKDLISGATPAQLIHKLGYDFVIQKRLVCHETIAKIYPNSVNSIRVITYQWKDKVYHCPVVMRIGSGNKNVDNVTAGGMFIGLEDDGTLHDRAFSKYRVEYFQHPDTKFTFKGHKIASIGKVLDYAHKLHELMPQIGLAHWDFTVDEDGEPVLLEANLREGGYWISQWTCGGSCFGERTGEILRWIAKMNRTPRSQRKFYRYGYMDKQ